MDYEKIYNRFIEYFKSTKPIDRLIKRNPNDFRVKSDYLYCETHHILPKALGGKDDEENLVVLLPEEHVFIHHLRYKVFDKRIDMLAVRALVNKYTDYSVKEKNGFAESDELRTWQVVKHYCSVIKQKSAEFRKKHGWQTKDGVRRISEARTGTMPVIDAITKEVIGSVDVNHPNVLTGKWVHHSKGKISVTDKLDGKKKYITVEEREEDKDRYKVNRYDSSGKNNSRYIDISDEDIYEEYKKFCIDINMIVAYKYFFTINKIIKKYRQVPSLRKYRFDGKGEKYLHDKIRTELKNVPCLIVPYLTKEIKEKYLDNEERIINYLYKLFNINKKGE